MFTKLFLNCCGQLFVLLCQFGKALTWCSCVITENRMWWRLWQHKGLIYGNWDYRIDLHMILCILMLICNFVFGAGDYLIIPIVTGIRVIRLCFMLLILWFIQLKGRLSIVEKNSWLFVWSPFKHHHLLCENVIECVEWPQSTYSNPNPNLPLKRWRGGSG